MESFALPLKSLAEEASWFVRDQKVRLLHVVTTADFRDAVMKVLMGQEFHADNRAPFVRLDDSFSRSSPGWKERAARVRAQHQALVDAMAKGKASRSLPFAASSPSELASFAVQVRQVADAAPTPTRGLVVVLAPTRVDDPEDWSAAVQGLIVSARLSDIRWIVVDLDRSTLGSLVEELGATAMEARAFVDEAALDREVAETLDRATVTAGSAPGPALMGAAWPAGVSPPPRPGMTTLPPAELKAAMIAAGISPAVTPDEAHSLRTLVLRAAQALKADRGPDAVRLQREARDLCNTIGMPTQAVMMELVLGTYLVQLGQRKLAVETFRSASERAETSDMPKEAAQAQLALGALAAVDGRPDLATLAYARAGELSVRAGITILAIEAYRLAGMHCADLSLKVQMWKRALSVATALEPAAQKASSAGETARGLATLLRKNGLHQQASEMDRQGAQLDAGTAEPGHAGVARAGVG
jgi:hypothetical protein